MLNYGIFTNTDDKKKVQNINNFIIKKDEKLSTYYRHG